MIQNQVLAAIRKEKAKAAGVSPRCYILINGILTNSNDHRGWNFRAESWIETHTVHKAIAFQYFTDLLFFRKLFQPRRVRELIALIEQYGQAGFEIVLVGHSNGGQIIVEALQHCEIPIKEIHLFAAACDASFDRNGINDAFARGLLGEVFLYGSRGDEALEAASKTHTLLSFFGLQYGSLGLTGPLHNDYKDRTAVTWRNAFGHSTWFDEIHFEETMRLIAHMSPREKEGA